MQLIPEWLGGRPILRGVERRSDGTPRATGMIVFPPSLKVGKAPVMPLEALVEGALARIITITDQTGDPVIKAQAIAFRGNLKRELMVLAQRVEAQSRGHD